MTPQSVKEAMKAHHMCVIVPTYNNAATLGTVVEGVLEYCADVIVVNDGSTDNTREILDSYGDRISVVNFDRNRGKGRALRAGFMEALARGMDYAVTIDSDGQHRASDIPAMVAASIENPGALVVGDRNLDSPDKPVRNTFANKFSNFWFRLLTGHRLADTQTGYRVYPLRRLHGLRLMTSRYEAEVGLLVMASWHGVKIVSQPVDVYYPPKEERVTHFRQGRDFTRISFMYGALVTAGFFYGFPVSIWHHISGRRIFSGEFRKFTHHNGKRLACAITLRRLRRMAYCGSVFAATCFFYVFPWAFVKFRLGRPGHAERDRLNDMMHRCCVMFARLYPGACVTVDNPHGEDFSKPAMIVCNHQSHFDAPVIMAACRKVVFITNDWAWHNPLYGSLIHHAGFIPNTDGWEAMLPRIRSAVADGYSVAVFPEGTRSADMRVHRFHQGAFYAARELNLDIVPMTLHGTGHYMPKRDFLVRESEITLKIGQRRAPQTDLLLRKEASAYRTLIQESYSAICRCKETAAFFKAETAMRYAWTGWRNVAECKRLLKAMPLYSAIIDNPGDGVEKVVFLNGGIGVVPLLFAKVNKDVEVISYESDLESYRLASSLAGLPANLSVLHAVWPEDFDVSGADKVFRVLPDGSISEV